MIKNLRLYFTIASVAILAFVTGCNKMETAIDTLNDSVSLIETKAGVDEGFGFYETDFIAGQNINAGTITISNDFDNVYVKFATVDGWQIEETHLYIGPKETLLDPANGYVNKNGSPKNGHFPYGEAFDPMVTEWVFALPIVDLYAMYGLTPEDAGDVCPIIAAHAVVKKEIEPDVWQGETAWGEGKKFVNRGNWSMYVQGYCVKFPPEEPPTPPTYELDEETAWAFDSYDHEYGGNWAKYIQYDGEPLTVMLLAGQKETPMRVSLTPAEEGKVRMVFTEIYGIAPENDGKWVLQEYDKEGNWIPDAIKIQGYDTAPSGNPAPGQFNTYKGRELDIIVDAANYYGIHLNVAKLTVIN